jgi:hypothetical protein
MIKIAHSFREGVQMPIVYRLDPERNLVLVEGSGVITDNDLFEFLSNRINDPLSSPNMNVLADLRDVERDELTMDNFLRFFDQQIKYTARLNDYLVAIVTNSDLYFGFTRIFMSMMGDHYGNMQVFRDMEEAKTWLFDQAK